MAKVTYLYATVSDCVCCYTLEHLDVADVVCLKPAVYEIVRKSKGLDDDDVCK